MKMMKPAALVAAMAMFTAPGAGATELPRYDVRAYCATIAEAGGGSDMIRVGCLKNEQDSYNTIKQRWEHVPVRAQDYCISIAEAGGGTYMILNGCLRNEAASADSAKDFEFRY